MRRLLPCCPVLLLAAAPCDPRAAAERGAAAYGGAAFVVVAPEKETPAGTVRPKIGHPEDVYGKRLPIIKDMGVGPTMAARVVGRTLYSIGQGKLHVFDISTPADPKLLGVLDGLGWTRQIAVSDSIAYITSRPYGVFIVSVKDPRRPELLCHFDSIGVAIGVAVAGPVLFVACASHGVQMVDISDPRTPRHLSTARTGEAQSVAVHDGYAYVGVWGSSELVVVDARNPRAPAITARCPLDGYGDGVV